MLFGLRGCFDVLYQEQDEVALLLIGGGECCAEMGEDRFAEGRERCQTELGIFADGVVAQVREQYRRGFLGGIVHAGEAEDRGGEDSLLWIVGIHGFDQQR